MSKLDHCNALFAESNVSVRRRLQQIHKSDVHLIWHEHASNRVSDCYGDH